MLGRAVTPASFYKSTGKEGKEAQINNGPVALSQDGRKRVNGLEWRAKARS